MESQKPKEKQTKTNLPPGVQSVNMNESSSKAGDGDSTNRAGVEKANPQGKVSSNRIKPVPPSNNEIDELLECPVCSHSMYPPIQQLFHCFGHYFCLHFEAFRLGTEPVYMAFLRFMGEESEAGKFGYCLEVGGNGRKLIWQGLPRSIRTHHRSLRESHDGLIIQRSLALNFSGGDQKELKLRVTGRIWKEL